MIYGTFLAYMLGALALTLLTEIPVVGLFYWRSKPKYLICYTAMINILTNISLNFLILLRFYETLGLSYTAFVSMMEIVIVLVEAVLLMIMFPDLGKIRAALASFTANAASFLVGELIQYLMGVL